MQCVSLSSRFFLQELRSGVNFSAGQSNFSPSVYHRGLDPSHSVKTASALIFSLTCWAAFVSAQYPTKTWSDENLQLFLLSALCDTVGRKQLWNWCAGLRKKGIVVYATECESLTQARCREMRRRAETAETWLQIRFISWTFYLDALRCDLQLCSHYSQPRGSFLPLGLHQTLSLKCPVFGFWL